MIDVLARVRLWLAVLILSIGGVSEFARQTGAFGEKVAPLDPAWIFYLTGAVGLGLRVFWARYLAICFVVAISAITVFWGVEPLVAFAVAPFALLLAGRRMRALYEDHPGWMNRWAAKLDARIARLRVLFVAQAVAMGLIWAAHEGLSPIAWPLAISAGLALVGLVLQHTWAVVAIAPIIVLEASLAIAKAGVLVHRGAPPAWSFTAVLLTACAASAIVVAPLVAEFARRVARDEPATGK
ncbi:MAG: hypothetical protein U0414_33815 [Polyangiaceae bacterium]